MKYFFGFVIIVVFASIIFGFFTIGSPAEQRERRFDANRVNHLQMIQSQLLYYWQNKSALPIELPSLQDDISGFRVPVDPESGAIYGYQKTSDNAFQLCATFKRESTDEYGRDAMGGPSMPMRPPVALPYSGKSFGMLGEQWSHSAGHVCFDRTIDTDLYRPAPPPEKK